MDTNIFTQNGLFGVADTDFIGLTRLTNEGLLTKVISLDGSGKLHSDGRHCHMSRGWAERVWLPGLAELATLIEALTPQQALALGRLQSGLPDVVSVATKAAVAAVVNDAVNEPVISRSREYIGYVSGASALALIDIDFKGMRAEQRAALHAAGGPEAVLRDMVPELGLCSRLVRASTSSGVYRSDTRETLAGSDGLHILIEVTDGGDIERFLHTLHEHCWAAGWGWHMAGAAGQLLERSLIDKAVCAPERLVFEAAPVMIEPLMQNQAARRPVVHAGPRLDTGMAVTALTPAEAARAKELKAESAAAMAGECKRARERFIGTNAVVLAARTGLGVAAARRVIERQCDGVLLPDVVLEWDDASLVGCSIGDVLRDPERFIDATLADPLEGLAYGPQKAKVLRRPDGSLFINSFAHGGVQYDLKYDARTARGMIENAAKSDVVRLFIDLATIADFDVIEQEELRNLVTKKSGIAKKTINEKLKENKQATASSAVSGLSAMIAKMNNRYMVVNEAGKAMVYKLMHDATLNRRYYQRISFDDLEKLHLNDEVWIDDKMVSIAKIWLRHADRRQFIGGIVFDPSGAAAQPDDELNLWQGFAVVPQQGSWERMKAHIYYVICQSNKLHYDYVMGWMARMIQFPASVGEVAIVMKGGEGVGKGMLARALRYLFGQHGLHITTAKHLVGNFNLHLRDTVLLFADEAFFAGDKAHVGVLNGLITEPMLVIEGKGQNIVLSPNYLHVIMASNSEWVVPASIGARRFFVLEVPNTYKGNRAYFKSIMQEMENGGYEAMLWDLLRYNLDDFEVRDIPHSMALQEQKKLSLPVADAWWMDVLLRGYVWKSKLNLPYFSVWQDKVTTEILFQSYSEYAKEHREYRPMSRESFGRFMVRMGGTGSRWRNGVVGEQGGGPLASPVYQDRTCGYEFGDLTVARVAFGTATTLTLDWEPCGQGDD